MQTFPERKAVVVTGMVLGHEPEDVYSPLLPLTKEAHFSPINFHRAVSPIDLVAGMGAKFPKAFAHTDVRSAVQKAFDACSEQDVLLVTGSFYLLGEVSEVLQSL
jgi:dihydrofolate synthase / folylpolyglutamate synthase